MDSWFYDSYILSFKFPVFWEIIHIKCDPYYILIFIYFISVIFRRDVTRKTMDKEKRCMKNNKQ